VSLNAGATCAGEPVVPRKHAVDLFLLTLSEHLVEDRFEPA